MHLFEYIVRHYSQPSDYVIVVRNWTGEILMPSILVAIRRSLPFLSFRVNTQGYWGGPDRRLLSNSHLSWAKQQLK